MISLAYSIIKKCKRQILKKEFKTKLTYFFSTEKISLMLKTNSRVIWQQSNKRINTSKHKLSIQTVKNQDIIRGHLNICQTNDAKRLTEC